MLIIFEFCSQKSRRYSNWKAVPVAPCRPIRKVARFRFTDWTSADWATVDWTSSVWKLSDWTSKNPTSKISNLDRLNKGGVYTLIGPFMRQRGDSLCLAPAPTSQYRVKQIWTSAHSTFGFDVEYYSTSSSFIAPVFWRWVVFDAGSYSMLVIFDVR
jgi:hypothetical protein